MSGEFRILVCGSRSWEHPGVICEALDRIHRKHGIDLLIHGDCRGADRMAEAWAKENEVPYVGVPAKWRTGKAAKAGRPKAEGVIRNGVMLERWRPSMAIGFHNAITASRGTRDMLDRCDAHGVPTWHATSHKVVRYDTPRPHPGRPGMTALTSTGGET